MRARGRSERRRETIVKTLKVGEITITSLIERDGPWRTPEVMFPAYDPDIGRRRLAELDPIVFDPASGRMVITYQTFLVAHAQAHHPDRHVHRRGQRLSGPLRLCQAALAGQSPRSRLGRRGHHACLLHASAFRPHGLEYDASQWPMDANLSEREIHLSQRRVRSVGGNHRAWRASAWAHCGEACRETHGATIAGRSSRPDRLCWSTRPFSSTTISRLFRPRATRHAIAASRCDLRARRRS